MKKIFVVFILSLFLCGCNSKSELDKIIEEANYIIVDVRTENEYKASHLVDAINIPYDEIDSGVKLDKNKTILVYCMSGNRSSIAYKTLDSLGYDVYDMGAFSDIDLPKE